MQFIVADRSVKVLAAAIAFLAKIGREIVFEGTVDGVVLRTLNDARSSFATVVLKRDFFESFSEPEGVSHKCRVLSKSLLFAFKTLRSVERVRLYFAEAGPAHYMVFQMLCRHDVTRTHSLFYEDSDVVDAVFERDAAPHLLIARPGLLSRVLEHMKGIDEVTVIAAPETATLKSFHRPEAAGSVAGALHSSLTVPASELLKYELTMRSRETEGGGTAYYGRFDVTFALKDLAALLAFAEERGVQSDEVALFFRGHGSPVLVSTEGDSQRTYRADLIMASSDQSTLTEEEAGAGGEAAAAGTVVAAAGAGGDMTGVSATAASPRRVGSAAVGSSDGRASGAAPSRAASAAPGDAHSPAAAGVGGKRPRPPTAAAASAAGSAESPSGRRGAGGVSAVSPSALVHGSSSRSHEQAGEHGAGQFDGDDDDAAAGLHTALARAAASAAGGAAAAGAGSSFEGASRSAHGGGGAASVAAAAYRPAASRLFGSLTQESQQQQ